MSANSNQSKPASEPTQNSNPPATQQGESQNQGAANPNEVTTQPGLSPEEIDARIADGIAKGLAAYKQQEAQERADAEQKVKDDAEKALEAEKAKAPKSTWPYGNKDNKHEFDLSKMTNWTGLPDDKVLLIIPAFNRDGAGNVTGYDVNNSIVQTVDPTQHKQQITPDKKTGSTTYGLLGYTPLVIHDPSK